MSKKQLSLLAGIMVIAAFNQSYAASIDPYEGFNRPVYRFNDFLDRLILKPVATLYNKIMPKPLNKGVSNMFSNLEMIPTVVNDMLQGNFYQSFSDTWRFGVNSTVGIAGFFDVGSKIGLNYNYEDFGLTLAQWGYKNSNYLVIPFLGASTIRDGIGVPVTYGMTVYPYIKSERLRYSLLGTDIVSRRASALRFQGVMDQAALDRYVFVRDAYLQHRNSKIARNQTLGSPALGKSGLENGQGPDAPILQ
jgi:phospholipid-binding lipoprotein MlaA